MQRRRNPTAKGRSRQKGKRKLTPGLRRGGITTFNNIGRGHPLGFPDRMFATLQYYEVSNPNYVAAASYNTRFKATSVFDPSFNGSLQPEMFDLFAAVYASYRVRRSRIHIMASAGSAAAVGQNIVVLPLNADPGAAASVGQIIAWFNNPYAKKCVLGAYGSAPTRMSHSMTTQRIFGSKMVEYDDNFAALVTADPVNNWYWTIGVYNNYTITATAPYSISIFIEFDVEFYDRKSALDASERVGANNAWYNRPVIIESKGHSDNLEPE
jgi:hypothetical protein